MRTASTSTALHARLERSVAAGEQAHTRSAAQVKAIMDARARRLAEIASPATVLEAVEVVTFALDDERYAVETRHVREIIRAGEIASVPGTPPFVVGLTNVRGELLVVVDLRQLFGFPARVPTARTRIAVMGDTGNEMGVLMDAVHEVTTVWREELLDGPLGADGVGREVMSGVTRDGCIVLDGTRLLADPRLFVEQGQGG